MLEFVGKRLTVWDRLAHNLYRGKPNYVIVNDRNEYYYGWGGGYSADYNGEWYSCPWTRRPQFTENPLFAKVFEHKYKADQMCARVKYYANVAVVGPDDSLP